MIYEVRARGVLKEIARPSQPGFQQGCLQGGAERDCPSISARISARLLADRAWLRSAGGCKSPATAITTASAQRKAASARPNACSRIRRSEHLKGNEPRTRAPTTATPARECKNSLRRCKDTFAAVFITFRTGYCAGDCWLFERKEAFPP